MNMRGSLLLSVALLTVLLGLLLLHNAQLRALLTDPLRMRKWVSGWGAWAPLAMVALQVAQVLLAVAGNALGSLLAFSLARAYGRPFVERHVPANTLARLDAGAQRRGLVFFVLVFLLPFLPDDLTCFAAGLTSIPIPALMLATLAGRPPGILVSCWLGANAVALGPTQWAFVVVGSVLLAGFFLRYGAELQEWTMQLTERLTPSRRV